MEVTDEATNNAVGMAPIQLAGLTIESVHEVIDSDRAEVILRCTDGTCVLLSCDPGYENDFTRTNEHWDVCLYDATDTDAGRAILSS